MKAMGIMNLLTLRTLRLNRVRTVVTIIGIILSTAMFTAVITIVTSLYGLALDSELYESGSWHLRIKEATAEELESAINDERVEYAAFAENIGYTVMPKENPDKPYIFIMGADQRFTQEMPIHITEGRMPENSSEILIPEHLLTRENVSFHVGEQVTWDIGARYALDMGVDYYEEGTVLWQSVYYGRNADELRITGTKTYTIVGFYKRPDFEPYGAAGYTAITLTDGQLNEESTYNCFIRLKSAKDVQDFLDDHRELPPSELHSYLLSLEGNIRYGNYQEAIRNFAIILSVLIFVGSVSLIYNAFSISVSERTRQFGILSSVGATRRQTGRAVVFEALLLSAVGIPLGVAAGVGGIAVTLYLLRGSMASLLGSSAEARVHVTWLGILMGAVIALITVLVSAWIPSIRAMRVSPIEAIRQAKDVQVKNRSTRYPRVFVKLFGAEGLLAQKYFQRSRKKYRITIFSLAMSVILFVSASAFIMYAALSSEAVDNRVSFDLCFSPMQVGDYVRLRDSMAEHVTAITGYLADPGNGGTAASETEPGVFDPMVVKLSEDEMTGEYRAYLAATVGAYDDGSVAPNMRNVFMDDQSFRELLAQYGLSEEGYFEKGSRKALVLNSTSVVRYTDNNRENYVFDFLRRDVRTLTLPDGEVIEIGALISEKPLGNHSSTLAEIIRPFSAFEGDADRVTVEVFCLSEDTEQSILGLTTLLNDSGLDISSRNFFDATEEGRAMSNVMLIVKVFSYGFIALISLISVANVFNTVTTNVALRRRDYAMLRSMGMTARGINRMSNFECLIYGTRSLLFGLPIAVLMTYLIYLVTVSMAHLRFELPWTAIGIAVISVFIVVSVSMLYSTGKMKRDNPIDALKEENI